MPDMSWKDAALTVLRETGEPMHYADLWAAIAERKLKTDVGATPASALYSTMFVSIRDDPSSPFFKADRGVFGLRGQAAPTTTRADTSETPQEGGLIRAFGMYWQRELIDWRPRTPELLGAQGSSATPVDFTAQVGVYMLYDRREVIYVGRTDKQRLGARLGEHTRLRLSSRWDRFSWFGLCGVAEDGSLEEPAGRLDASLGLVIATMEALLIEGIEPRQNRRGGDQLASLEFEQRENEERARVRLLDEMKRRIQGDGA